MIFWPRALKLLRQTVCCCQHFQHVIISSGACKLSAAASSVNMTDLRPNLYFTDDRFIVVVCCLNSNSSSGVTVRSSYMFYIWVTDCSFSEYTDLCRFSFLPSPSLSYKYVLFRFSLSMTKEDSRGNINALSVCMCVRVCGSLRQRAVWASCQSAVLIWTQWCSFVTLHLVSAPCFGVRMCVICHSVFPLPSAAQGERAHDHM